MSNKKSDASPFTRAKSLKWKCSERSDTSVSHLFYLDDMELHFEDVFPFPVENEYLAYSLALPKILNTCVFSEPSSIELPSQFKYMVNEEWFCKTLRQVYNYSILLGVRPEYPRIEISSGQGIKKIWLNRASNTNQVLSLLSFGKDSALNTILAKTMGYDVMFLTCKNELFGEEYNEQIELKMGQRRIKAAEYLSTKYGLKGHFISTKLHYVPIKDKYDRFDDVPTLNVLNAYFCALPFCEKFGYSTISAGNDYACNLDVQRRFGVTLHYNLDKTVWFMRLFRRFLCSLDSNLRLESFVEPFVDWETQALLATIDPEMIPFQTSCESVLCNNCDKCLLMWLVLKILGYEYRLNGLEKMTKKQIKEILENSTLGVIAGIACCLKYLNLDNNDEKVRDLANRYNFATIDERLKKCSLQTNTKTEISKILKTVKINHSIIQRLSSSN